MHFRSIIGFLIAACGAALGQPALAGLVQEPWDVGCVVSNQFTQSSRTFIRNENPFQNSHTATLGSSSCSASYDFAWTGNVAHFDIYPAHHLEQLDGFTSSSGQIYIRPSVDSFITLEGTWQYAWPSAALGVTNIYLALVDIDAKLVVTEAGANGGNVGVGPPFGTFAVTGDGILEADRDYYLYYIARVSHFDPTPPGTYGSASGALHFNITPVPEPAALALLVIAAIMSRRTA